LQSSTLLPLHSRTNARLTQGNLCTPLLPFGKPTPHRSFHILDVDVIVGATWLESLEAITLNFLAWLMKFIYNDREIKLHGLMDGVEDIGLHGLMDRAEDINLRGLMDGVEDSTVEDCSSQDKPL
jgi:hypothetical protein